jgi:phosphoribosyl-AMP cyclohydrolase
LPSSFDGKDRLPEVEMTTFFEAPSSDKAVLEEGAVLSPRFDSAGLVTAVVADATDNEILMLAHMNAQALQLTIETGIAHYWSRSRNSLWKKGETSGNLQMVDDIRVDCDQDAVLLKVRVAGSRCNLPHRPPFVFLPERWICKTAHPALSPWLNRCLTRPPSTEKSNNSVPVFGSDFPLPSPI